MHPRAIPLLLVLLPAMGWAGEATTGPEAVRPGRTPAVGAKKVSALDLVAEEERWVFTAPPVRPDIFVDLEAVLQMERQKQIKASDERNRPRSGPTPIGEQPTDDLEKLVAWAGSEEGRIRLLLGELRYDEAIKACDAALKPLEPHLARPEVAKMVVSIRTYRAQAEEAKLRDDAQRAFEALHIRVLGVLWSQDAARMAIIDGENRALSVNDRVKDCVVINIDQDRVDFRYVYVKRRFEFPVYVDQSSTKP